MFSLALFVWPGRPHTELTTTIPSPNRLPPHSHGPGFHLSGMPSHPQMPSSAQLTQCREHTGVSASAVAYHQTIPPSDTGSTTFNVSSAAPCLHTETFVNTSLVSSATTPEASTAADRTTSHAATTSQLQARGNQRQSIRRGQTCPTPGGAAEPRQPCSASCFTCPLCAKDPEPPSGVAPVMALHQRIKHDGQGPVFLAGLGHPWVVATTRARSCIVHAESVKSSTRTFIGMKRIAKEAYTTKEDPHNSPQISREEEYLGPQ